MTPAEDQYEKDVQNVIKSLKQTDPINATRQHAVDMLGNMRTLAHLIAHKVVDKQKTKNLKCHEIESSKL